MFSSRRSRHARARGFTLVEMIAFIIIVGIALTAMMQVLSRAVLSSADPLRPKQAMLVAESMLEEVLLKPYANPEGGYECTPPPSCDRRQFDDVSDYHNYQSTGVYALDDLAMRVPGLENYNVQVTVAPYILPASANSVVSKQITVVVSVMGTTHTLSGYRFNYD